MRSNRSVLYALLALGCVVACAYLTGCGLLKSAAKSPTRELFDCRVEALKGLVGPDADAETILFDIYTGKVTLPEIVAEIAPTRAVLTKLNADMAKCNGAPADGPMSVDGEVTE